MTWLTVLLLPVIERICIAFCTISCLMFMTLFKFTTWLFSTLMKFLTMLLIVVFVLASMRTSSSSSPSPSFSLAQMTPIEAALSSLLWVFSTTAIQVIAISSSSSSKATGNDCDAIMSEVSKTNRLETANSSSRQSAKSTSIESGSIVEIAPHLGVNSIPLTSLSSSVRFSVAVSWVSSTSSSSGLRVVVVVVAAVWRVVASGAANKIAATTRSDSNGAVLVNDDSLSDDDDVICSYPSSSSTTCCSLL